MKPKMIFHAPYPLNPNSVSASGIRPVKMREAFQEIGYEVFEITGFSKERSQKFKELKRRVRAGEKFDFLYSENATIPNALADPSHLPVRPFLDQKLFVFCKKHNIKTGVFYRDVYWRFPIYDESVKWPLSMLMRATYTAELKGFVRAGVQMFLPSTKMAEFLPVIDQSQVLALPPGVNRMAGDADASGEHGLLRHDSLNMLYVGGLGSNYQLEESVREIANLEGVSLTICTPKSNWDAQKTRYQKIILGSQFPSNIKIVHGHGMELNKLYQEADLAFLVVNPIKYWSFAAPVKLFEYIGSGKPILVSAGTHAANIVSQEKAGWVVSYGSGELTKTLEKIMAEPAKIVTLRKHIAEIKTKHTWAARAQQVAEALKH